jgi:hypothetical protein
MKTPYTMEHRLNMVEQALQALTIATSLFPEVHLYGVVVVVVQEEIITLPMKFTLTVLLEVLPGLGLF